MHPLTITWDVDPIFFSIGSIDIAYYGLMWVLAFTVGYWLFGKVVKREGLDPEMTSSAFITLIIATVIGARLGHVIFYDLRGYLAEPWEILNFRGGGMASHGAALGLLIGIWIFCRKWKVPYIWMLDRVGIVVAIGGAIIRIGNLINSEVYGTPTKLPWGFRFVNDLTWKKPLEDGGSASLPVHPTQIYEAFAYMLIFALMWHMYWRTKAYDRRGLMFGIFLILLFGARFLIESIKQVQSAFEIGWKLDMGQILSLPFIAAGMIILIIALRRPLQPYINMPKAKPAPKSKQKNKKK